MIAFPIIAGRKNTVGGIRTHSALTQLFALRINSGLGENGAEHLLVMPIKNANPRQLQIRGSRHETDTLARML